MELTALFWSALPVVEVVWIVVSAVYLVLQRRSAQATLAWVLALAFLPLIGIAVYVFIGPRRFEKRKKRRARARAAVHDGPIEDASGPKDASERTRNLIALCEHAAGRAARPRHAALEILRTGRAKYAALERAISEASHHVHLEYYIWEPDRIGTRLRDALVERAKAGVEVRVLVDGFGSSKAHDRFWGPLVEAGGRVRRFNELSLARWRPRMANFRTHRKIAVIDGAVGFTGGMNVTDVHTDEHSGEAAWRDTHVRLEGPAVKGLSMVFFEDWGYATGEPAQIAPYVAERERTSAPAGSVWTQIVASGPDEDLDAIHKLFFASIAGAGRRVLLTTPYFVPDEPIFQALTTAALRGADVRVLVPAAGDVPLVAAAARSYYPELVAAGVRIFEHGAPVLHAKTLVIDDVVAIVGTANTDNRSFRLNFEVVCAIYDAATCEELAAMFAQDLERSREVTRNDIRKEPFARRLYTSAARLLSPIL